MREAKSKHCLKGKFSEEPFNVVSSDFERDDDDPLSIKSLSISFLGILIAFLTILLPSISVLLVRPVSQGNEMTSNHSIKKDGS